MQLCGSLSILWHCFSLGLEIKQTFSSPVATAEFSKFAGILSEEGIQMVNKHIKSCFIKLQPLRFKASLRTKLVR